MHARIGDCGIVVARASDSPRRSARWAFGTVRSVTPVVWRPSWSSILVVPDATLVCWNVAGRLRRQAAQADRMAALSPDIVCLQEVIARSVSPWTEYLTGAGLCDLRVAEAAAAGGRDRPLLTLVASRWEQQLVAVGAVPCLSASLRRAWAAWGWSMCTL